MISDPRKCRFCSQPIRLLATKNGKAAPVEATPYKFFEGAVVPDDRYYVAETGELYTPVNVPRNTDVYRSHWKECPGADQARKRR